MFSGCSFSFSEFFIKLLLDGCTTIQNRTTKTLKIQIIKFFRRVKTQEVIYIKKNIYLLLLLFQIVFLFFVKFLICLK